MPSRAWLGLVLAHAAAAQSAVVDCLTRGDLPQALALLEAGQAPTDGELRLRAMQLLLAAAANAPARQENALRWAAQLLPETVPARLAAERKRIAGEVGGALARALVKHGDVVEAGRIADRTHAGAVLAARDALLAAGQRDGRDMTALALHGVPVLRACDRTREAAALATDGLTGALTAAQEGELRGQLGLAQLTLRRFAEAVPNLQRGLAANPADPRAVLPIAQALPASHALAAHGFLLPVVQRAPEQSARGDWTRCLESFYATLDALDPRDPAAAPLLQAASKRRPMPQVWDQREWGPGFRVWQHDDARPGKVASGKDGLRVGVPQSAGWRQQARPPDDLVRWNNCAFCFQRDADTVLAVYWFGPNLEYWYGDTPRERGVTGKTVRGHSAGAIARFTWDVAYGEDARKRGVRFAPRAALPFALATGGQRRTFVAGEVVYDETVFAHGQVSVSVLLRVPERDLELLEPELRWLYRSVAKD